MYIVFSLLLCSINLNLLYYIPIYCFFIYFYFKNLFCPLNISINFPFLKSCYIYFKRRSINKLLQIA